MLAYVFWHWPAVGTEGSEVPEGSEGYEAALTRFHSALAAEPSSPVAASASWALAGVPWAPPGAACYADWYLVAAFADLATLKQAATSGAALAPHDTVAARSAGGIGGLYQLRAGRPDLVSGWETWFAKPAGWTYQDLETAVTAAAGPAPDGGLWQRQLVLGPGPEWCLVTATACPLPPEFRSLTIPRRPLRGGSNIFWGAGGQSG